MNPRISESEWAVMQVLWDSSPLTADEIIRCLGQKAWSPRTVKSLLHRLVGKEAIRYQVDGKRYVYSPRLSREACQKREAKAFLKRVFDGKSSSLLAHFVRTLDLSAEDIDELKRVVAEREEG